jgi:hypothetical protein
VNRFTALGVAGLLPGAGGRRRRSLISVDRGYVTVHGKIASKAAPPMSSNKERAVYLGL